MQGPAAANPFEREIRGGIPRQRLVDDAYAPEKLACSVVHLSDVEWEVVEIVSLVDHQSLNVVGHSYKGCAFWAAAVSAEHRASKRSHERTVLMEMNHFVKQ